MPRPFLGTTVLSFALLALGASPLLADRVFLRDGRVLSGRVIDRGAMVELERPLGSLHIDRRDIRRIELERREAPVPGVQEDVVVLKSGRVIRGHARISDDQDAVIVSRGEHGEVSFRRGEVQRVIWAEDRGQESAAGTQGEGTGRRTEVDAKVEQLVADLYHVEHARRARAQQQLASLGAFAVEPLQRLHARAAPEAAPALTEMLARIEIQALSSEPLDQAYPNLVERIYPDPEPAPPTPEARLELVAQSRQAVVEDLFLRDPDRAMPILLFLLRQDDQLATVRSQILAQLRRLGRHQELVALLGEKDGRIAMGAALALGDNGLYLGLPVLIDALGHARLEVRELALRKLEEYSGETLDFDPRADEAARREALVRWETWWKDKGEEVIARSLRGTIQPERIADAEKSEARKLWRVAHGYMEQSRKLGLAAEERETHRQTAVVHLTKALEQDPTLAGARINLAEVLLEGPLSEAVYVIVERELLKVISQYRDQAGMQGRRAAQLLLGGLYRRWGRYDSAVIKLRAALQEDPGFLDGHLELARTYADRAYAAGEADKAERLEQLQLALEEYGYALESLGSYRDGAEAAEDNQDRLALEDTERAFTGGPFRRSLLVFQDVLKVQEAEIHYQIGRIQAARQEWPAAAESFHQAAELQPQREDYRAARDRYADAAAPAPAAKEPK